MEIVELALYPGYGVDRTGGTWTKKGKGYKHNPLTMDWKPLKQHIDPRGYLWVNMRSGKDSIKRAPVHQLVLFAFVSSKPQGAVCRHLDGNPSNNTLDNLRWGTQAENYADSVRHGTSNTGERNWKAILTSSNVIDIRNLYHGGASAARIAMLYGVSTSAVRDIVTMRNWAWLR